MQEGGDRLLLVEPVLGGKGECVDAAEFAVRRFPDKSLQYAGDFRLHGLAQHIEQRLGFTHAGILHRKRAPGQTVYR